MRRGNADAGPAPLVSVIIPAHNAEQTIGETLASALAQTYRPIELVVVDDGSTDRTPQIVTGIANADERLLLIRQDNRGVAAARNAALMAARGEWIACLDADDLWHPEKIERQMARVCDCPVTGMVYCWSTEIDRQSHVVRHRLDVDRVEGNVYAPLVLANFIGNGSVPLIRRDLLLEVGGWNSALRSLDAQGCEDWELYLRLADRAPVLLAPGFLVGYRQSDGAMSRNITTMRRSYGLVMREARRSHPELPSALFRWSRAAFNMYVAELLHDSGQAAAATRAALGAVLLDPSWVLRPSTRVKLGRLLRSLPIVKALRAVLRKRNHARAPAYPIGWHFRNLRPEPHIHQVDGRAAVRRRRRLSGEPDDRSDTG